MIKISPNSKFQQLNKPALTRNGNEYKPSRIGSIAGTLAAGAATIKAIEKDSFGVISKGANILEESLKAKGLSGNLKAFGKSFAWATAVGLAIGAITALGALIGNTLIDAPINQELRDQADGEAARRENPEKFYFEG